jgi:polar amino acid transport system substrate-binding protein
MPSVTRAAGVIVGMAAVGVAACGGGVGGRDRGTTTLAISSASKVATIAAEVPSVIAAKGTLTVASDAEYAPNEFIAADGHTVIGMDADLAAALGQVMGLRLTLQNATFDTIIPGVASGKYELSISSIFDTKEHEKTVDFVTYYRAGTSFMVKASGGPNIKTLDDLCGHHVAVERGTAELDDATAQDNMCKDAGKAGVDVQTYADQSRANTALTSGRADIDMADSPVAEYQSHQSNGQFKLSGQPYGVVPYGIAIPKNNGMAKPILDALKELMSDGIYTKIMEKWSIAGGAIGTPVINGAVS